MFFLGKRLLGIIFGNGYWLFPLDFVVGPFDFGLADEIILNLLDCAELAIRIAHCVRLLLPFRLYVPSGRFAGPTEKPFLAFLDEVLESSPTASTVSRFLLIPILMIQNVLLNRKLCRGEIAC